MEHSSLDGVIQHENNEVSHIADEPVSALKNIVIKSKLPL